jgi:ABC-2 type transport system permease protein
VSAFTGVWKLAGLVFRRERRGILIYAAFLILTVVGATSSMGKMYPTPAARLQFAGAIGSNATYRAFVGPLFDASTGGLASWRMGEFIYILIAVMAALLVIRNTRGDEDSGRFELVAAGVVGRLAPLGASLIVAAGACCAIGAVSALGQIGLGQDALGALSLGLSMTMSGLVFAAIAADARSAISLSVGALVLSAFFRFVGDGTADPRLAWVAWFSPIAWSQRVRPYGDERWWLVALTVIAAAAISVLAFVLNRLRDANGAVLPEHAGRTGSRSLNGPLALAWRLHGATLIGWMLILGAMSTFYAGIAKSLPNEVGGSPVTLEFLRRYGGPDGGIVGAFFEAITLAVGLTVAVYPLLVFLRMRAEEADGRAELILAGPVSRLRWAGSHILLAAAGSGALLAFIGLCSSLALAHFDPAMAARLFVATLMRLPAVWTVGAMGLLVFALRPRLTLPLSCAVWIVVAMFGEVLGPILGLNYWVANLVSPFHYIPRYVGGGQLNLVPVIALVAVSTLITLAALAALRRRDIG